MHLEVGLDGLVGHFLDLAELLGAQRALAVEVETKVARPVQRTGLNSVGPQHLSQRRVHHVGARMSLGRTLAPVRVHGRDDGVALDELPRLHVDAMHPQGFRDLLHVGDGCPGGLAGPGAADSARVGELATDSA